MFFGHREFLKTYRFGGMLRVLHSFISFINSVHPAQSFMFSFFILLYSSFEDIPPAFLFFIFTGTVFARVQGAPFLFGPVGAPYTRGTTHAICN